MDQLSSLFGAYDIRGVVGQGLDSPTARSIARAFGEFICPNRPGLFLIGHDARWSSPALSEAVSVGLREAGHRVVHIGVGTTPMVYWYGAEGGFDGSIAVTASHLPPDHNGFKLCGGDALPLSGEHGLPEIAAKLGAPPAVGKWPSSELVGRARPLALYVASLRSHLRPVGPLKVAVDAGNGVGGIDTEPLFSPFDSVRLWRLSFHPDGSFPERSPNPLDPGALDRLAHTVVKEGCDFGIAFDGDADRAVAVNERGEMVPADLLGALIALHLLKTHPGAVVLHDLRASRACHEFVEQAGGRPLRTRVGHAFIKAAMREHHALFAAELSGHFYYADLHYTDNGLRTLIELINLVSAAKRPLSSLLGPLQRYATSGEINRKAADPKRLLEALEARYRDGRIDHLDGLSVDYPDWWFNARPSHTEPLLRVNVGALNQRMLDEKRRALLSEIDRIAGAGPRECP